MFEGKLPTFTDACKLVVQLHDTGRVSFDVIEQKLRKSKIPIFLFGEVPSRSLYTKCIDFPDGKYALMIAVRRSREIALKYADSGCSDVKTNLLRLKNTMMCFDVFSNENQLDLFVEKQVQEMCSDDWTCVQRHFVPSIFARFKKYLDEHPNSKQIISERGIVLSEIDPNTLRRNF